MNEIKNENFSNRPIWHGMSHLLYLIEFYCLVEFQKSREYYYLNNTKGIDLLGDLMEPSFDSIHPEFYGAIHNYGHILLGQITDPKGKFNVCI